MRGQAQPTNESQIKSVNTEVNNIQMLDIQPKWGLVGADTTHSFAENRPKPHHFPAAENIVFDILSV
jgi:hypothetical protein